MDMNQYLDMFIEESKEHLQFLNEHLLNLEKEPDNKDLINEIFRIAHTIKGMSGTMGFNKIASLTHEMENLLDAVRSNKISICSEIVDLLFSCFDVLDDHISNIVSNGKEGEQDDTFLIQQLNDKLNGRSLEPDKNRAITKDKNDQVLDEYVINAIKKAKSKGMNAHSVVVKLSDSCLLKSARAFIVFNTLESYSEIVYSSPSTEDIEDERFDKEFTVVLVTEKSKEEIKKDILMISEIEKVEVEELIFEPSSNTEETFIDVGSHEIVTIDNKGNIDLNLESKKFIHEKKKTTSNIIGKTVRVDIDRLDNLMNLVSELIIIKTRLEDTGNVERSNLNETIEYLERITTSLHDAVMKVRMVPIERVFNRFPRMVRDLSKELGKEVELEMSGEETEVDRTIIDEIGDPLIHLIRNSLDHGIEDPDTRKERGKPTVGKIILKAYPDGNNVVIELEDDGAGINVDRVKKKAVDRGLLTQAEADELTLNDAINLLFLPGFSTAKSVSDVSGRGVGLDVVKNKIESINGVVEVETSQYKGSKFSIRLPLTLAIIPALLINLKEEIYALPLSSIREITPVKINEIRKIQDQEVVLFRNKTLPIIRLNRVLGIQDSTENEETTIVVVKKGDKEAGLLVDKLIGQQEIVIKSLGKFLLGIPYLAGATILGNGQISLILDVNSLF